MKTALKNFTFFLAVIIISPFIILCKVSSLTASDDQNFATVSQLLSLIPGKTGSYLRTAFYSFCMQHCKKDCVISFLSIFSQQATVLESGVYIGPQCNIGDSHISRNTLIGSGVHIMSGRQQHHFDNLDMPIRDQGGFFQKIKIGEDCWIGNGALIMANIGNKCIIGSGSVVINDIPDYSIVAGNPAKIIKIRDHN